MATIQKTHWTPARLAALAREDAALDAGYPGEHVAYTDTWVEDRLTRRVLAHARDAAEFHQLLAGLDAVTRQTATLTRVPDPDAFSVPSVQLA